MPIFLTIVGLSLIVLAHEFGHFITAKLSKIRVDEFGFGFPPRLFARRWGETTYSINALLFGGFVRIYGEDGEARSQTTKASESTNNFRIVEKELSYRITGLLFNIHRELGRFVREKQYGDALERVFKEANIPYQRELPVSVEGRFSNTIDFLVDGKMVLELKSKPFILKEDYFQTRRYLETTGAELGLIVNFRERYLKPKRVLNPNIRTHSEHSDVFVVSDRDRSFATQPVWRRMLVTCGGVLINIVVAWLFFSTVFMAGAPEHLVISDVVPGSPAAAAGIVSGDIVREVRGGTQTLTIPIKVDAFVALVKEAAARNEAVILNVGSVGVGEREVSLMPRATPPAGEGALGVGLAEAGVPQTSFFRSFLSGAEETWALAKFTVLGLVDFFGRVFNAPGTLREAMGPVGIAAATAAQASTLGFSYLLRLLGFISLNLAVLNLIPFPALDGGRALFLLIEKLKGSPLPAKFERIVNAAGFLLLISLMVAVTVQDIGRL